MNKQEMVASIASKTELSKKDAQAALEATLDTIKECLEKGDAISFIGFGTFSTAKRAARTARVPGTGKEVQVPSTTAVKFKVGKSLKDAVAK